ncbi:MAG: hypothetical protein L0312_16280 [Acidobacteria bacterium]|nr:hypothetical protein [Acidobacteriota bacterium]
MAKPRRNISPRNPPNLHGFQASSDEEDELEASKSDDSDREDYFGVDSERKPAARRKAAHAITENGAPEKRVVAFGGERKLSKKDQERLRDFRSRSKHGRAMDAFMRGQADEARKQYGHKKVFVGQQSENLVVCVPIFTSDDGYPGCLPFEFLVAQDGFPLGLIIQLVAKHGIGKSALLAEFFRWFDAAGGGGELKECETKFNPHWYRSIMGDESFNRLVVSRCSSVEDWQDKLTFGVRTMKSRLEGTKKEPGPGRTVPIIFGVDSIMGKQSEETQEKILGKRTAKGTRGETGSGHASRGYPIEAQVITRYIRTIPDELDDWPFSIVLVNHLRITTDDMGNQQRQKSGGEQVNFQESFELELRRAPGPKKIECSQFEGFGVEIGCEKNSFGPTHRRIQTRLLWWEVEDPETGDWKQKTVWDWDWSTVHLLWNLIQGDKASPRLKASLKAADFHLECPSISAIENRAWSDTLGMKPKGAAPWHEVGALIRRDAKLMKHLRKALFINRRPIMAGDYLQQVNSLTKKLS